MAWEASPGLAEPLWEFTSGIGLVARVGCPLRPLLQPAVVQAVNGERQVRTCNQPTGAIGARGLQQARSPNWVAPT